MCLKFLNIGTLLAYQILLKIIDNFLILASEVQGT